MTTTYGNPAKAAEAWLATVLATVSGVTVKRVGSDTVTTQTRAYPYVVDAQLPELMESGATTAYVRMRCIIEVEGPVAREGATPTGKESTAAFDMIYKIIKAIVAADYEADKDTGTPYNSRIVGVAVGRHDGVYARSQTSYEAGIEVFITSVVYT